MPGGDQKGKTRCQKQKMEPTVGEIVRLSIERVTGKERRGESWAKANEAASISLSKKTPLGKMGDKFLRELGKK